MRKLLFLVLSLTLGLSLVLTIGCQKKPGEEQNKAVEKPAEVKDKADEKATEVNAKAGEKASEVNAKVTGWDSCKGCHTDAGKPAPSKADLLKKFKTEKELITAAKRSKNPMMSNMKKDDLLKAAAKDLGLK